MNEVKMGFKHTLLQRLQGLEMLLPQQRSQSREHNDHGAHNAHNSHINRNSEMNSQTHIVTDFSIQKILSDTTKPGKSLSREKSDFAVIKIPKNYHSTLAPSPSVAASSSTSTPSLTPTPTLMPTLTPTPVSPLSPFTCKSLATVSTPATTPMPTTPLITEASVVAPSASTLTTPILSPVPTTARASQYQIVHPIAKKPFNNSDILDLSMNKSSQYTYDASPTSAIQNHASTNQLHHNYLPLRLYESFHPNVLAAMAAVNAQKFYAQVLPQMFAAGIYTNNTLQTTNNINHYHLNYHHHQARLPPRTAPSALPTVPNCTKRYFAPCVINAMPTTSTVQSSIPTAAAGTTTVTAVSTTMHMATPNAPRENLNNFFPSSSALPPLTDLSQPLSRTNKLSCNRLNCLECLNAYYRTLPTGSSLSRQHPLHPTVPMSSNSVLNSADPDKIVSTRSNASSLYRAKVKPYKELPVRGTSSSPLSSSSISSTTALMTSTRPRPKAESHQVTSAKDSALMAAAPVLFCPTNSMAPNIEEISYKCCICEKVFGCSQTLQAHEKTHKSPRYECSDCGKGFSQLRNYKYHLSVHRGTKEFAAECPECRKTFNDKGYLSSHMKIHRNKKEYQCPYCPKSFNQRVAFNMHVRIHTGVKPHKCAECGKRFSRKMLLKQHMRTHSGEKPYQCSVCGKSFADRSNMTLHHRLHSGIKPFNCPICPKAFTKKHHLKTHLNYHTGCKPYICPHPNCHQAFTQSSNMRTHAKKCQYRPIQLPYPTPVSIQHTSNVGVGVGIGIGIGMVPQQQSSQPRPLMAPISMSNGNLMLGQQVASASSLTVNGTTISTSNGSTIPSPNALTAGIRMLHSIATATVTATITATVTASTTTSTSASPSTTAASGASVTSVTNVSPVAATMPLITFSPSQQPLLATLRQHPTI